MDQAEAVRDWVCYAGIHGLGSVLCHTVQYTGHDAKPSGRLLLAACSLSQALPREAAHKPLTFWIPHSFPVLDVSKFPPFKIGGGGAGENGWRRRGPWSMPACLFFLFHFSAHIPAGSATFISSSFFPSWSGHHRLVSFHPYSIQGTPRSEQEPAFDIRAAGKLWIWAPPGTIILTIHPSNFMLKKKLF